jgi:release factor glutamine methyltransferase
MSDVYEPAEDSYLMSRALTSELPKLLKENPKLKFLEIGIGSGINLQTALKEGVNIKNILGFDINNEAVNYCKSLGFNCLASNLFENITGEFDIIIFNPPYLPLDKKEPRKSQVATTGGKKGNEIAIRFLKEAKKHINKEGRILIITSSLAQDIDFNRLGYRAKKIGLKKLFFEVLSLWKISIR